MSIDRFLRKESNYLPRLFLVISILDSLQHQTDGKSESDLVDQPSVNRNAIPITLHYAGNFVRPGKLYLNIGKEIKDESHSSQKGKEGQRITKVKLKMELMP